MHQCATDFTEQYNSGCQFRVFFSPKPVVFPKLKSLDFPAILLLRKKEDSGISQGH